MNQGIQSIKEAGRQLDITGTGGRFVLVDMDTGAFGAFCDEPTAADLDAVRFGMSAMLRISDLHWYTKDGRWVPLWQAELIKAPESEIRNAPAFHHVKADAN